MKTYQKYDEDCNTGYFLEVNIDYPKGFFKFQKDLPFLPERKFLPEVENFFVAQKTMKNMLFI